MLTEETESNKPVRETQVRHEVIASLEGARITIEQGVCRLDEYNFVENCWANKSQCDWPLSRDLADRWLHGWNRVDQFKARNMLIRPEPD